MPQTKHSSINGEDTMQKFTWKTTAGLAQMLKGGVIMDVVTPEQAKIAEEAGAVADDSQFPIDSL